MKTYSDFCEALSKQLFTLIDQNQSLLNWRKQWDSTGCAELPFGAAGTYRGANLFTLFYKQFECGYKSNQWLTFNQIRQRGGCVKKGAKGQSVYFWKILSSREEVDGEEESTSKPLFKSYYVFNLDQTTLDDEALPPAAIFSSQDIDALVKHLGVSISHFGGKAFYSPKDDVIVLPEQKYFSSEKHYFAVLLHELVHWTGGRSERLPRDCMDNYGRSDKARAQEELVAEVGSLFLTTHFGIDAELEHHASYVQSWKKYLTEKEIMAAVAKASKAFSWLLDQVITNDKVKAAA